MSDNRSGTFVVVGDVMLDEYVYGVAGRISQEAPVPVVERQRVEYAPGGAANVAANLAALGAQVVLAGVVGDDARAGALCTSLNLRGIDIDPVLTVPGRVTTHKLRILAQGQQLARLDHEEKTSIDSSTAEELLASILPKLADARALIISDYGKGVVTAELLAALFKQARALGIVSIVDPKGINYERYRGATYLTPNITELEIATGMPARTPTTLDHAAQRLLDVTKANAILVTCGRDGMVVTRSKEASKRIPAEAKEVFDVTGAGDTVVAAVAWALARGMGIVEAAQLANRAAGIVVGKLGTAAVTQAELFAQTAPFATHGKLLSRSDAAAHASTLRTRGQRLVFTNGCFDLLHAGHVAYLEAARALGDVLVVGLNSDSSVAALKGATRPVVSAADRARVLGGLGCVDQIVIFDEETPLSLIRELRPDVLVKGADYSRDEVAGADWVASYGGRVELMTLHQGASTSKLITDIVSRHIGDVALS